MRTLEEYRTDLEEEACFVDVKSHSHNIVSLLLGAISEGYGKEEANKAIRDFKLDKLGWAPQ